VKTILARLSLALMMLGAMALTTGAGMRWLAWRRCSPPTSGSCSRSPRSRASPSSSRPATAG